MKALKICLYRDKGFEVFKMSFLVEYKGEIFQTSGKRTNTREIRTTIPAKAAKYDLELLPGRNQRYQAWVPVEETTLIGRYFDRYRVKCKDHFFSVEDETGDMVKLHLYELNVPHGYLDVDFGGGRTEATKWVYRSEIMEIADITERLCFFKCLLKREHFTSPEQYQGSDVFYILDENETHFLLKEDSYWKRENPREEWVPKKEVFVYNETDEPIEY